MRPVELDRKIRPTDLAGSLEEARKLTRGKNLLLNLNGDPAILEFVGETLPEKKRAQVDARGQKAIGTTSQLRTIVR